MKNAATPSSRAGADYSDELFVRDIKRRILKNFLDVFMLVQLKRHGKLSGYDLAVSEAKKFEITLSPGTIYAALYSLERKGFVKGEFDGKKTSFLLTPKGESALGAYEKSNAELSEFMKSLFFH